MKAGKTSIEQWLRLGDALEAFAQAQDWDRVAQIDQRIHHLLEKNPPSDCLEEVKARQGLAQVHQRVLGQLIDAKDRLAVEINKFQQQREGLEAYRRTELSIELDND